MLVTLPLSMPGVVAGSLLVFIPALGSFLTSDLLGGAKQVMIGKEVLLSIKIGNVGTGAAAGVVLEERVPPGLKHPAGAELEFEVGTLKPGETPQMRLVRFRTLGCYPLTGAVESSAATLAEIIQEMLVTTSSERQGRVIDHDQSASMEKKKQEGYF
jgi:3'-phosphoadenosine 5'-phosphosulfate sulfotransferase (PAPS reductase)/FAD synthetase